MTDFQAVPQSQSQVPAQQPNPAAGIVDAKGRPVIGQKDATCECGSQDFIFQNIVRIQYQSGGEMGNAQGVGQAFECIACRKPWSAELQDQRESEQGE